MDKKTLMDFVRRWMNGDGSVIEEIVALGKPATSAMLKHVDAVGKRSVSMEKLGNALRKRMAV